MTGRTHHDEGSTHIIRYALELGLLWIAGDGRDKVREALDALDTLEAQLEAIGAGGVSGPLMGRTDSKERAGRFTKKPVTIDAWLIDFGNKPLPDWVNEAFRTEAIDWCPSGEGLYINTLEGHMLGANGSWLIKGVQGELYACKPDIFAATYERASIAASAGSEPVATVFTMEALAPGGGVKYHATVHKPLPAGTKLYTHPSPPEGMAGGWMPIETAPRDGTEVLANTFLLGRVVVYWDDEESQWGTGLGYLDRGAPTHWMPLTPAPTSAEGVGS